MLPDINIGSLIDNRYLIKKKLGQGEFIKTYLASDIKRFDELCIIKELININKEKKINQKNHFFLNKKL